MVLINDADTVTQSLRINLWRAAVTYHGNSFQLIFSQQIADKEFSRKDNIMKSLDSLCAIIGDLDINLPEDFDYRHAVINRAMDVRSAAMLFLSSHIKHDRTPFGTAGVFDVEFHAD